MNPAEFAALQLASVVRPLWWALMKPFAIRLLVREIDFGVQQMLDQEAEDWARYPIEMGIISRVPGRRLFFHGQRPTPPWVTV